MPVTNIYSTLDWTVQVAETGASWSADECVHSDADVATSHKLYVGDARELDWIPDGSGAALPPFLLVIC
jgi:hypothetical protein